MEYTVSPKSTTSNSKWRTVVDPQTYCPNPRPRARRTSRRRNRGTISWRSPISKARYGRTTSRYTWTLASTPTRRSGIRCFSWTHLTRITTQGRRMFGSTRRATFSWTFNPSQRAHSSPAYHFRTRRRRKKSISATRGKCSNSSWRRTKCRPKRCPWPSWCRTRAQSTASSWASQALPKQ